MSSVVVDSSVVAKWILPEPGSDQALRILSDAAENDSGVIILDLALIEVANAIWRRHHRQLIDLDRAKQLLDALIQIPVRIEPATPLLTPALTIAAKYDRSIYDALFVAACAIMSIPGVTADEPLIRAVQMEFPLIRLLSATAEP